ncbi:MAG: Zn-dependent hydrolase [Desulfobacula sp.]|jgi:beta-ureidopropionase / N-carbamoyl-L-amino-acid hydrolase|uniref:Zn-dependent hydrolase n=3 Tax=Desulfobacula sp. TaxID=2593537 RepID=UPI001E0A7048|nr:Zn-dependent hydrolase [Desulfobacula sp.]MBT4024384.1 Zn-dependent hydrolase [Desulfobacula sp.]MBT4875586.1 Zn-dependent hydrolase [Desulfobacula sp.]MBT5546024.1 Zn-dependent hydrolase [Desulfobacula sp.]MBT5972560.1 Zn-dependent hydrolase [Desulfobacula sp.]
MNSSDLNLRQFFSESRMQQMIDKFAQIGKDPDGGVTRLAFSPEDKVSRERFIEMVETTLNLNVRIDAAGNIFARRNGKNPDLPVIMTGSHLDSVRNGGKYDGPAGVFSSFEAFRVLDLAGIQTDHPFELCVMTSEEPNTFGISTFGSRAMTGRLTSDSVRHLKDSQGKSIEVALKTIGVDLETLGDAIVEPDKIKYFIELHIEQMPFLEREKKDIGVVEGVTAIYRESIVIQGTAAHCGTTPMAFRKDALCAAAEIILCVESAAGLQDGKAVATVGTLDLFPNSINIIPGKVQFDFEIRSFYLDSLNEIKEKINDYISEVQDRRHIKIDRSITYDKPITQFSAEVIDAITTASDKLGLAHKTQVSLAGHDAAHVNSIARAGLIFIPCKDGLSHCPEEFTETQNIVKGSQCLLETLLILDKQQ